MQLKKYEIKTYVAKDIYRRVTQEAQAQRTTRAKIIRDCLFEYFTLREEMASAIEAPGKLGDNHTGRIIHTLLARSEERYKLVIKELENKMIDSSHQLNKLVAMVDRFYFNLLQHLPKLPNELTNQSKVITDVLYEQWQKEVNTILAKHNKKTALDISLT